MSGFKLFEIDSMLREALEAADLAINQDTGEVPSDWADFLEAIELERDKKALAVAAVIREKRAEVEAIKSEVVRITKKYLTADTQADRLENYLAAFVKPGEKLKDARVSIGWRKSTAVIIDDESKLPESCFKIIPETKKPILAVVKDNLLEGGLPDGSAHIEERQNIQIR